MTFIPNTLTISDSNNSGINATLAALGTFPTTYTSTAGYNMIVLNIKSTQDAKIEILFSNDGTNQITSIQDTYIKNTFYSKNYKIMNKFYKVIYTNSNAVANASMESRLSTVSEETVDPNFRKNYNNYSLDAFGKLRVSYPNTLLDIKFPVGINSSDEFKSNQELVCIKTTGTGSITYPDGSCMMTVGANDECISQSRKYCVYQPGKSQLFLASGIINAGTGGNATTTASRIGDFDDNNGLFFEYSNQTLKVVVRRNGAVNDDPTLQSNWNIDKMDGYGPSGLTLNPANLAYSQLFVIDFEWLGVGKIRFGFYANGIINYCHEITNINDLNNTTGATYMLTGNLPIRFEIKSTGGTGSLKRICSSVISEGGYNPIGKPFSINTGSSPIRLAGTEKPLLAIRGTTKTLTTDPFNQYNHENILPKDLDFTVTTQNATVLYKVRLFQSYTGFTGTWTQVDSKYSVVEYIKTPSDATDLTKSILIDSGYAFGRSTISFSNLSEVFNSLLQITSDLDGTSDILLITGTVVAGTNVDVCCSLTWQEIY